MVELNKNAKLTPKQKDFLDFLARYSEENGFAPSQQEMATHFGYSSLGTVQNYLVRLEALGLIRKSWNTRHGIEVVREERSDTPRTATELPLLGLVAAGLPIENLGYQETVEVPSSLLKRGEHFVLRVKGDSMIEEGIHENDLAIIRKQTSAANGQTVVALINNSATIKKYFRFRDRVELHPANPRYEPIVVGGEAERDFRIEGILVGLIRKVPD